MFSWYLFFCPPGLEVSQSQWQHHKCLWKILPWILAVVLVPKGSFFPSKSWGLTWKETREVTVSLWSLAFTACSALGKLYSPWKTSLCSSTPAMLTGVFISSVFPQAKPFRNSRRGVGWKRGKVEEKSKLLKERTKARGREAAWNERREKENSLYQELGIALWMT